MSEKPKRPWFRFHLLTAVLMMVAAGGMLWANVDKHWYSNLDYSNLDTIIEFRGYTRGWPFIMQGEPGFLESAESVTLQPPWLALNFLVSLGVVAAVAFASEYLIRRREGRKP